MLFFDQRGESIYVQGGVIEGSHWFSPVTISHDMRMEKVPQVLGKRSELMELLIDEMPLLGVWGCDKFCIIWNLPGFLGLGMMLRGNVWEGSMRDLISDLLKGLM